MVIQRIEGRKRSLDAVPVNRKQAFESEPPFHCEVREARGKLRWIANIYAETSHPFALLMKGGRLLCPQYERVD